MRGYYPVAVSARSSNKGWLRNSAQRALEQAPQGGVTASINNYTMPAAKLSIRHHLRNIGKLA